MRGACNPGGDARKVIEIGVARVINVKPPRVGGFWKGKRVAEVCQAAAVPVWCGGMLETGVGKAFNIHLSTLPNFSLPGDTSGNDQYFEQDVLCDPIVLGADSCIAVPRAPGLGYEVDERALRSLSVTPVRLTAP